MDYRRKKIRIGDLLIQAGAITEEQLSDALEKQRGTGKKLGEFLVEQGVITDDRLAEINAGKWEGRYLTDIEKEFPEQYSNWCNAPALFHAPDGESMSEVYNRMKAAVDDIIKDNDGKTVCIVSHGCAIKCLMCYLHGWTVDNIAEVPLGTNTSVNVVKADGKSRPEIIIENYTDHL